MSYRFDADFSYHDEAGKPYDILIEKNSDLDHLHSTIRDQEYHVMVSGNRHFAQTPPLKNFRLHLKFKTNRPLPDGKSGIVLFFRYDLFRQEGYALACTLSDKLLFLELSILKMHAEKKVIKKMDAPACLTGGTPEYTLTVAAIGNKFTAALNDIALTLVDDKDVFQNPGQIGVDKIADPHLPSGALVIKELSLSSEETPNKSLVMGPLAYTVPCVNGMSVPYTYALELFKYDNGPYELAATLSGGIKERADRIEGGPGQWHHEIDRMTNPYVRMDSPKGELKNILLYNGALTLLDREEKNPYLAEMYAAIAWPLQKKIYFNELPDPNTIVFAVGYEHFENEPQRFLEGSYEVMGDSRGNVLYQGAPLRRGNVAVSVKSSEHKRLYSMIPKNIADREKALVHVRENHYFVDDEKIDFDIQIHWHADLFGAEEFKLLVQVQTIYGDTLEQVSLSSLENESFRENPLASRLGIQCLRFRAGICAPLETGVYHLAVTLLLGNKQLYAGNIVFEVMSSIPGSPCPPTASGLPVFYTMPNEIKYRETDGFDPWSKVAGAMHYFSMSGLMPEYARSKRTWELTKLYHRKWYASITGRGTNRLSIEENKDIIEQCDFVEIAFTPPHGHRFYLERFICYRDELLDILIDFFRVNPEKLGGLNIISMALLEEIKITQKHLPEAAFLELFDHCWKEWREYVAVRLAEILKRHQEKLKAVNKNVGKAQGGPGTPYTSHNKSVYDLNNCGYSPWSGIEKYLDGFFQYEDYHYECGYSVTRAVYFLMTVKLYYSTWKIFPEIYDTLLTGCSDSAVYYAHPPCGLSVLPELTISKRVYEYAFAAVWFKNNTFHFWNDYGFHLRASRKACVNELVRAWGNVVKHKPVRPVKTICFLTDISLMAKRPDYYEKNCNSFSPCKCVYNLAEESLAYTYNAARNAGMPAGFVTTLDDLQYLNPDITDFVVLPPLNDEIADEHIAAIRKLHQQGVNLLGFENVHGLEDLFGVTPLEKELHIRKIGVTPEYAAAIGDYADECVEHELSKACYENTTASAMLSGAETVEGIRRIPVLLVNKTQWGATAFFNIPPTVVRRDSFVDRFELGQECLSPIIKAVSQYLLTTLSVPCIYCKGAKTIAFYDQADNLIVIVEDDSPIYSEIIKHPQPFLLSLRLPGIRCDAISCDKEYSVARDNPGNIVLRLSLDKYESAIFKVTRHHGFG